MNEKAFFNRSTFVCWAVLSMATGDVPCDMLMNANNGKMNKRWNKITIIINSRSKFIHIVRPFITWKLFITLTYFQQAMIRWPKFTKEIVTYD